MLVVNKVRNKGVAGSGAGGGARAQISGPLVLRWINRVPAVPWLLTLTAVHTGLWKGRALRLTQMVDLCICRLVPGAWHARAGFVRQLCPASGAVLYWKSFTT